jgi:hypothetical protein
MGEQTSQRQPESKTIGQSQYGRGCPGWIIRPEANARGRWMIEPTTVRVIAGIDRKPLKRQADA